MNRFKDHPPLVCFLDLHDFHQRYGTVSVKLHLAFFLLLHCFFFLWTLAQTRQ